ncbi:bifunctional peptidase and arginyl-hydroxylase JMJD5-like [Asterias rubens]|uniref:bifunctional peptidase and arginyl-hydroxylase JMJD5-like n=1 Tax=Asterias rubens TaxID=7604 RepID=UPI001455178B|nr:bifunctional peptidase and arginyl-hydroxylase JMJD5-like [Asterias rubens]
MWNLVDFVRCVCVVCVVFLSALCGDTATATQAPGRDEPPPAGHLKPLGWHRPAEPDVDTVNSVPEPKEFFEKYVRHGRPLLMKGAAKNMAAFKLWKDDYLRSQHGELEVEVEEGKKENRSRGLWSMKLHEFLDEYGQGDIYMVSSVLPELAGEVELLRCMHCGGFTEHLQDAVIWFSSGSTKSVLHYDAVDNINCVLDGKKEIFLVDKREKENIDIDHPDGSFSGVDVDRVDMYKYPGLGQVPWYNVTMEPSDCFFIPYRWYHQVRSLQGRNLAINIWFVHLLQFIADDCRSKDDIPDFTPLEQFQFTTDIEQLRGEIANCIDELENGYLDRPNLLEFANCLDISEGDSLMVFQLLDEDQDERVTLNEVYSFNMMTIQSLLPDLISTHSSTEELHDEL